MNGTTGKELRCCGELTLTFLRSSFVDKAAEMGGPVGDDDYEPYRGLRTRTVINRNVHGMRQLQGDHLPILFAAKVVGRGRDEYISTSTQSTQDVLRSRLSG